MVQTHQLSQQLQASNRKGKPRMIRPLTESLTFDQAKIEVLHEGKDDNKHLKMKGVFIQGGVKNQNQRVYPVSEISKAVSNIKERLDGGFSVLGEADHPENLTVNLDRVSHMIEELEDEMMMDEILEEMGYEFE